MDLHLQDKVVIVTGGAAGIGAAISLQLAAEGAIPVICGKSPMAAEFEDALMRSQPKARFFQFDLEQEVDCRGMVQETIAEFGRIDGLVNNAGRGMLEISGDYNRTPALFWQADPQGFGHIIDANVTGAFLMARACVPAMVAQGYGRVVNISTSRQTMVRTGSCPYGPSKAALEAMSVIWAKDLQGSGVTVNVLLPGGASDTRLLPDSGSGRRGADGQLLAPALMRAPIVWLMGHAGPEVNGERYIARLWRTDQPWDRAAAAARDERHELPAIM